MTSPTHRTITLASLPFLAAAVQTEQPAAGLTNITNDNIRDAVKAWRQNSTEAVKTYGNISAWDVSKVKDMRYLFACSGGGIRFFLRF
tara:strand:+ start:1922 stop:2185 length:264 start_codon:yes stop_codon:yes gene_type:complete